MASCPIAVIHGARRHDLLAMSGAIFHQGAAQVAIRETPGLAQIGDTVMDVDLRLREFLRAAPEAQHRSRSRPYLHQADFADASDRWWVVVALDVHDGIGDVWRKAGFLGFLFDHGADRGPEGRTWMVGGLFHI